MSQPNAPGPIPSAVIEKVLQQAQATASHSWEYGVVFEALLEYLDPSLTVFKTSFPEHQKQLAKVDGDIAALKYVKPHICTDSTTLCESNGKMSFFPRSAFI